MTRLQWAGLALCLLVGCSSGGRPEAGADTPLTEVRDLLLLAAGEARRTPASLANLDRATGRQGQAQFPRGYGAVKSGDVVVLWGTTLQGEGNVGKDEVVVAYEKDVPTSGGFVLLSAGTVKKMTADEFKAARTGK
jgi:hypothetical protein